MRDDSAVPHCKREWGAIAVRSVPCATVSAESSLDVILRTGVIRALEHLLRRSHFDQLARFVFSHEHEGAPIRDTVGLLHVVRGDRDGGPSLSSPISSSMRLVANGSSAEVGSSINRTSGSTASARAIHNRCCSPPDSVPACARNRSRTPSQSAATIRDGLRRFVEEGLLAHPVEPKARDRVVVNAHGRERIRALEPHSDP